VGEQEVYLRKGNSTHLVREMRERGESLKAGENVWKTNLAYLNVCLKASCTKWFYFDPLMTVPGNGIANPCVKWQN
jgi:hypothetical protein